MAGGHPEFAAERLENFFKNVFEYIERGHTEF
jgi:hypothetical protein